MIPSSQQALLASAAGGGVPQHPSGAPLLPPAGAPGAGGSQCSGLTPLDEFKAREAAARAQSAASEAELGTLLKQHTALQQRIDLLSGKDSRWWPERTHLQAQLGAVEKRIQVLAQVKARVQQAEEEKRDRFSRLCSALAALLCRCEQRTCLLSEMPLEPRANCSAELLSVQREWRELQMSRIIRKSTGIKEVLQQRANLFELYLDSEGRQAVRFAGEKGTTDSRSLLGGDSPSAPRPALPASTAPGQGLVAGQLRLLAFPGTLPGAAHSACGAACASTLALASAPGGGCCPAGALGGGFLAAAVSAEKCALAAAAAAAQQQLQLAQPQSQPSVGTCTAEAQVQLQLHAQQPHPALLALHGDLRPDQVAEVEGALLRAGGSERFRKICLHCGAQEAQLARHFRLYEEGGRQMVTHLVPERGRFELLLFHLVATRAAVSEAMVFCIEHAAAHAAMLVQTLVRSLELENLGTEKVLARLFLLSDVLFNSRAEAKGASTYRTKLEELLPDVFERLGRCWLPRVGGVAPAVAADGCGGGATSSGGGERQRAEAALRSVLGAWRTWDAFPAVFVGGLEALALAAAPEPSSELALVGPENEQDLILRGKLARWCHEVEPAEIRVAARRRGLAGPGLSATTCRLRFCHYERYWHSVGLAQQSSEAKAAAEAAGHAGAAGGAGGSGAIDSGARREGDVDEVEDSASMNGEPLSDAEARMLEEEEAGGLGRVLLLPEGRVHSAAGLRSDTIVEEVD